MSIKERFGKLGSRFAFEFFLETMHDSMVQGLKNYLSSIKTEDFADMVRSDKFPSVEKLDFSVAKENIQHIEKISLLRIMEFIADARPDLAEVIQNQQEQGALYLGNLRVHILNRIRQSSMQKEFKPQADTVMARCDKCEREWPVTKEEAAAITECPFCGAGRDEKKEESAVEEKPAPEEEVEEEE